ncbi:5'-3' exonuclease [Prochlorococcus marinus str. MU1404]|uniref:5'-3' exonuclease n=1 Tax=Prochlorococcus marinus TaxID=1219 RepID=UPI001ADA1A5F|nr:5'-3' exonuclease [Prochlorococcus marinus]MBO8230404.1 5'-3' exonuclease [Prochlorococcus marinus XMU1404]MBW3072953.1 5'-3' exonuclease [Prochlorococcus marinus str. MU1404]MCR8545259.1 5'-3' exonuclease [Prochlorococcus marinus CUG1432]
MDKTNTWLIRLFAVVLIGVCLIAYLNVQKKPSILFSKPSIEDLKYKELNKKRANAEFAAKRDYTDYEKFGSIIFCNASFNSRIESANYSKQMELYISGKEADLSEWDTAIKDYENERSKCRDFNP